MITARLRQLGISTSHFTGQAWARGKTVATHAAVARVRARNTRPTECVFVENSPETCGYRLVKRLVRLGWTYACVECGITEWRGVMLRLHLDHINGIHTDNRFDNLRLLCPNCHSLTRTYCGRNRRSNVTAR